MTAILNYLSHFDTYLITFVHAYGLWVYVIMFAMIFAETGIIIVHFLPGDSLLFTAGIVGAAGALSLPVTLLTLAVAAVLGDTLNYFIGSRLGSVYLRQKKHRFIKLEHFDRARGYFGKYGGLTVLFCRFIPMIRVFAPFIAGATKMHYRKFISYNVIGGALWVAVIVLAGFFLGNIPFVRENFHYLLFGIFGLSVAGPLAFAGIRNLHAVIRQRPVAADAGAKEKK